MRNDLHVTGISLNLSYLEKNALNLHYFCFDWPYNWTLDMIVHCTKSMCFIRSIFACVNGVYFKTENEHSSSWNTLGEKMN